MLWEQMVKDETGKVSWAEFANRFTVDPTINFQMADRPKTEEQKAEEGPKKIATSDFKRIQEVLYLVLRRVLYDTKVNVPQGKNLSIADIKSIALSTFQAERETATAEKREVETWAVYSSISDADAPKLFDFGTFAGKQGAKLDDVLATLEKRFPKAKKKAETMAEEKAKRAAKNAPVAAAFNVPTPSSASALEDAELKTVSLSLREWVADMIFNVMSEQPWTLLRMYSDKVAREKLLAFPALPHWGPELMSRDVKVGDPRIEKGGLLMLTSSLHVAGVKYLPLDAPLPGTDGKKVIVVYAQFHLCCQITSDCVVQWRMRTKMFLNAQEKPIHMYIEDAALWVDGDERAQPSTVFADWDFPDIPFQEFSS